MIVLGDKAFPTTSAIWSEFHTPRSGRSAQVRSSAVTGSPSMNIHSLRANCPGRVNRCGQGSPRFPTPCRVAACSSPTRTATPNVRSCRAWAGSVRRHLARGSVWAVHGAPGKIPEALDLPA